MAVWQVGCGLEPGGAIRLGIPGLPLRKVGDYYWAAHGRPGDYNLGECEKIYRGLLTNTSKAPWRTRAGLWAARNLADESNPPASMQNLG